MPRKTKYAMELDDKTYSTAIIAVSYRENRFCLVSLSFCTITPAASFEDGNTIPA